MAGLTQNVGASAFAKEDERDPPMGGSGEGAEEASSGGKGRGCRRRKGLPLILGAF